MDKLQLIIDEYILNTSTYHVVGTTSILCILFFISIIKTNTFNKIIKQSDLKDLCENKNVKKNFFENIKKNIYNEYKIFNIDFNGYETLLNKLLYYTLDVDLNPSDFNNIVSKCFTSQINNDNLIIIKDYIKFYNNPILIKWIVNFSNIQLDNIILDANCKINSFYDECRNIYVTKNKMDYDNLNIFGLQPNDIIRSFQIINNLLNYNNSHNIAELDPLINDFNINGTNMFDIIFYDMPHGIHNVIHANCCQKIKKLKLRGTKAEPLLLQLVMTSLNKNGKGVMIVPDSLLFSDSIQPIETREYLLKNFNVKNIIQIDESFYWGDEISKDLKSQSSTIKNSILYFENNGKTSNVNFSKISLQNNKVNETKICDIDYNILEQNLYSLYYKNYLEKINKKSLSLTFMDFSQLFTVKNIYNPNDNIFLGLTKNYKSHDSIKILSTNDQNFDIFICEKKNEELFVDKYLTYFLEYKLKILPEQFTTGKMKQFDIKKIEALKIPVISKDKQNAVCSYLNITNIILSDNNNKIELYKTLINHIIETIPTNDLIDLESITTLYQLTEITDDLNKSGNLIGIIKNGLNAGTVYLPDKKLSNNSHYLIIKNNSYLTKYVYQYLYYSQDKLIELSKLTPQPNLTKSNLMNFKIPNIDISNQEYICSHCDVFNSDIEKCINSNNDIKQKDIVGTIIKLNNF